MYFPIVKKASCLRKKKMRLERKLIFIGCIYLILLEALFISQTTSFAQSDNQKDGLSYEESREIILEKQAQLQEEIKKRGRSYRFPKDPPLSTVNTDSSHGATYGQDTPYLFYSHRWSTGYWSWFW